MTKCSEIDRLILIKAPGVKELIDQSVRKAVDTQRMLERYQSFSGDRPDAKYKRLSENFGRASSKLEDSMRKFNDTPPRQESRSSTQLRVMNEVTRTFPLSNSSAYRPPNGYEYISSMEEGIQGNTLTDLNRINKEMNSLQDIYYSLSEVASSQQGSLIDSVQGKLSKVTSTASSAVQELNRAKDRLDYWTRIKMYSVTGLAAIGIFFWVI